VTCWHCDGKRYCSCITCASDGLLRGPCVACKGREKWEKLGPILDRKGIDIRDAKHWVFVRPDAPYRAFRRFIPEFEFDEGVKRRKTA
jgi:hypothetical protein